MMAYQKCANSFVKLCTSNEKILNEFMKYNDIMCHIRKLNKLYEPNNISSYVNENKYFEYNFLIIQNNYLN